MSDNAEPWHPWHAKIILALQELEIALAGSLSVSDSPPLVLFLFMKFAYRINRTSSARAQYTTLSPIGVIDRILSTIVIQLSETIP